MWQLKHHGRTEPCDQRIHLLTHFMQQPALLLLVSSSGAEEVEVMASKQQDAVTGDIREVRSKVRDSYKPTLPAAAQRLAGQRQEVSLPCVYGGDEFGVCAGCAIAYVDTEDDDLSVAITEAEKPLC